MSRDITIKILDIMKWNNRFLTIKNRNIMICFHHSMMYVCLILLLLFQTTLYIMLCGEETNTRQNKCNNTTDKICLVFALNPSYHRCFVSSPRRNEKTKRRQIHSLSYFRFFVSSYSGLTSTCAHQLHICINNVYVKCTTEYGVNIYMFMLCSVVLMF